MKIKTFQSEICVSCNGTGCAVCDGNGEVVVEREVEVSALEVNDFYDKLDGLQDDAIDAYMDK